METKVVILGAGGRDFHTFNTCYRDDASSRVVAFTATQIPGIDARTYPPELAGPRYPDGIPIVPESEFENLGADLAVFAYSDVPYDFIAQMALRVIDSGCAFRLFDPDATMLQSKKPCVAVCAVRTGCGKSALTRYVAAELRTMGLVSAVLRHPMPYGDLRKQVVQRFERVEDLAAHECTIEEMEEYEPHIAEGTLVFAGADYARILAAAEAEADVILWDGGNNDLPFIRPDLYITMLDPLRAGDEVSYFPSRWNLQRADVLVIGKTGEADADQIARVRANAATHNAGATVLEGRSPITLENEDAVRGKRVLVVEDGPTTTHGGMGYGAGLLAAKRAGAGEIVDPRPFAKGGIAEAFAKYPHLENVLPALGYGEQQRADLEATIDAADCDVVVVGTPIDLARVVKIRKPNVRALYSFEEAGEPQLPGLLRECLAAATR